MIRCDNDVPQEVKKQNKKTDIPVHRKHTCNANHSHTKHDKPQRNAPTKLR